MADIHLIGGEKGGSGKSFFCRTVVQYHLDNAYPFVLFETDRSNPDVKRIYQSATNCLVSVFSEGEKFEDAANAIYNAGITSRVLVNLPAQVFIPVRNWFENNDLLTVCKDDGVRFYLWFVSDGGYESLKLLKQSLDYFKGDVTHVVVRNWGKCDDWDPLSRDDALQKLFKKHKVQSLDFPKFLGTVDRHKIDADSLTFGEARVHPEFSSISRQRVKRFLSTAYEAIAQTEIFGGGGHASP